MASFFESFLIVVNQMSPYLLLGFLIAGVLHVFVPKRFYARYLSRLCTGADDRMHDCRARTVLEAIMWHGSSQSDARWTVERFRALSKPDRDAIVKFIESI